MKFKIILLFLSLLALLTFESGEAFAAEAGEDLLQDRNGDGVVTILAFGDSLTFGIGDGVFPGDVIEKPEAVKGGYPKRLAELLGVVVLNGGKPGELLTDGGIERFPQVLFSSGADLVVIMEGTNDAIFKTSGKMVELGYQRAINIARALNVEPIVATIPKPCCNALGPGLFTDNYSSSYRALSFVNEAALADIDLAWKTTCSSPTECDLYVLPEGLHPNSVGYDVIAQVMAASILGVDIFVEGGAKELEDMLGLEAGSVVVKPLVQ